MSAGGRPSFQKRKENGKLAQMKRHKDLDEEDVYKIEENRHINKHQTDHFMGYGVFKDWLLEKGTSTIQRL